MRQISESERSSAADGSLQRPQSGGAALGAGWVQVDVTWVGRWVRTFAASAAEIGTEATSPIEPTRARTISVARGNVLEARLVSVTGPPLTNPESPMRRAPSVGASSRGDHLAQANRLPKSSAVWATSRQPWSIVRAWPRFGIFTISVIAGVAPLPLVGGVGDRPRHRVILLALDD
jgi:hypothetical protein